MKLKRILSLICILTLLATCIAPVGITANTSTTVATVSAGEATVEYKATDAKVSIPIEIDSNVTLTALQMSVSFDSTLSFTKYTKGDSLGFTAPQVGSNPVKLIFLDTTLAGVEATKGTLATLEFSVPTDAVKDFDLT
ncbi:MAG: hypothetical protein IJN62_00910, partial [Clostridia bacterium]|nr:hypothetical protein [Clostridia bacterium]